MDTIRNQMATHLEELVEDGEIFRWLVVRAYHAAWLQHLELGRATWADDSIRLKLWIAFKWHRLAPDPCAPN